ncbi:metalloregulator ArsR/SmtB family transcription factor [Yoonia sp. SS1-5]|uniref:ArsR/SmtB family transcription factor n=1 Tax=Yoonia rhodophyticola TaxID=3137370 RepID=A0AAN0MCM3_9RHOB
MQALPETFAALGDPTRFAIVEKLLRDGELSAGTLHKVAALSAPAMSRHLKVLRNAGVIRQRIDKQRRLYAVEPQAIHAINDWAISYRAFWTKSLDRLDASLRDDN